MRSTAAAMALQSSTLTEVSDLLDQIDVDRFGVMGSSMGGQYAAALGHALPHQVTRVAIITDALPLYWDPPTAR